MHTTGTLQATVVSTSSRRYDTTMHASPPSQFDIVLCSVQSMTNAFQHSCFLFISFFLLAHRHALLIFSILSFFLLLFFQPPFLQELIKMTLVLRNFCGGPSDGIHHAPMYVRKG